MYVWVIYDIKLNKTRNKIIKYCKECGMYRVQKSVFFGNIYKDDLFSLKTNINNIMNIEEDSIYIFPMSKKHFEEARFIGLSFDKSFVTSEEKNIFF